MRIAKFISAALVAVPLALSGGQAGAAGAGPAECKPKTAQEDRHFSFQGVFGHYDHNAALRGFEVYRNACATCHSLDLFAFRNLAALGATEAEIKGVAAEYEVMAEPNDEGEVLPRPALPADHFPAPFPNDKAAAAVNNGAVPPDLSLMVKARPTFEQHIPHILLGYQEAPEGCEIKDGQYYNAAYPGYKIAMAPPLFEGAVEYGDGTPATIDQMVNDVTQFLAFVAEPKLEERKQMGVKVVAFLIILTIMLYLVKKQIWRKVH